MKNQKSKLLAAAVVGALLFFAGETVAARTGLYAPLSCKMYMVNFWKDLYKKDGP